MLIVKNAQPVMGKRTPVCESDESRVSRIHAPHSRYDGMVERLQKVSLKKGQRNQNFELKKPGDSDLSNGYPMGSDCAHHHLCRFIALGLAGLIHPDNFVRVHELRFFERGGVLHAATYSDFVPDENGVLERIKEARGRFAAEDDAGLKRLIRIEADARERALVPDFAESLGSMEKSGIGIPHPEANYHLHGGKIVFFEVLGIEILKIFKSAWESGSAKAIELVAALCCTAIRHQAFVRVMLGKVGNARECANIRDGLAGDFGNMNALMYRKLVLSGNIYHSIFDNMMECYKGTGIVRFLDYDGVNARILGDLERRGHVRHVWDMAMGRGFLRIEPGII